MKSNIDHWVRFANDDVGLDVKDEDIYFVRGWVKTTRWAVVAFSGNSRHARLRFQGDLSLPVSAAFQIDMQSESAALCTPRIGPDYRPSLDWSHPGQLGPRPEDSRSGSQPTRGKRKRNRHHTDDGEQRHSRHSGDMRGGAPSLGGQSVLAQGQTPFESDQCMFLHYFKIKRRLLLPRRIEAAAEPQDPAVDRDADAEMIVEEVPPRITVSNRTASNDLLLTL